MAFEDDRINWRTVFSKDQANCKITTFPNPTTEHTVIQPDETKLLCTNTPDAAAIQKVSQGAAIQGIWPAVGSLRVTGNNVQSGSGSSIVYTVPANKKLYIHSTMTTMRTDSAADVNGRMGVRNDADTFQYYICYIYMILQDQISVPQHFYPALEAAAGWDIYMLTTHANVAVRGLFHGWLEDV